mmetsp:Transcript_48832/g.59089  ORF Transcript_48832/g.59089 Transcript_48832/m.59089 type:complete len:323 (-) Transcript_48832:98-1066(-)
MYRNCARALNGNCDYDFQENETVFTFTCPAKIIRNGIKHSSNQVDSNKKILPLPQETWGIAIDDSKVQRKLLHKFLSHTGIETNKIIIKGETLLEIRTFDDFVVDLVKKHPQDLFLIIVDENMDCTEDDKLITISGSLHVQNILKMLDSDLNKQILALVRSANDSSADIAKYEARAHGFINKAPIVKNGVEKILAPLWIKRFGIDECGSETASDDTSHSSEASSKDTDNKIDLELELKNSIDRIDVLIKTNDCSNTTMLVMELLHALKGDLMTYSTNDFCVQAMDLADAIRASPKLDERAILKWGQLKELVISLVIRLKEAE